ncbi:MAG: patatin-like phospholipase family protein [Thiomicrospira sp.]|uniref:patatin-like phospholipase family protein n=1 Tax=Thiomicrospira sp. TaxID=935 RepID=UPI001A062260|nr:patatin-like phospholipase family protein [Thiomicrospira sp.]MBE0493949.1 patatin-like phospholipase family protein [Thiomicrospira sp.]
MNHPIKDTPQPNNKTVSLVLGSGGARGLAHIGVIRWLEENGYKICSISGASMGALIGGLYATQQLDEYENWLKHLSKTELLSLIDVAWDSSGLIKGEKLFNKLADFLGDVHIEDLDISYTAVATDIDNEKEVWLQSGLLLKAIRSSISLPMIFTPFKYHDMTLIDGGVLNPVPIAPTFSDKTDLIIAVNLGGKPQQNLYETSAADPQTLSESSAWLSGLTESVKEFLADKLGQQKNKVAGLDWNVFNINNRAFDIMQNTIARQKLASYPPDITINIPRNACGMLEFNQIDRMVKMGYEQAGKALSTRPGA